MSEPLDTKPRTSTNGTELITAERLRQIYGEGYDEAHDRGHASELMMAAESYLNVARTGADGWQNPDGSFAPPGGWPWAESAWKPKDDRVRDLAIAGGLIAAAIDALTSVPLETGAGLKTFTCFGAWVDGRLEIDYALEGEHSDPRPDEIRGKQSFCDTAEAANAEDAMRLVMDEHDPA